VVALKGGLWLVPPGAETQWDWVELPDPPEPTHLNRVRFTDVYAAKAVGWLGTPRPRRGPRGGPR